LLRFEFANSVDNDVLLNDGAKLVRDQFMAECRLNDGDEFRKGTGSCMKFEFEVDARFV
jgi:hypothetical protein